MFSPLPVPPNAPAVILVDQAHHSLTIQYNGRSLFEGVFTDGMQLEVVPSSDPEKVEQTIACSGPAGILDGTITATQDSFAAETLGPQQKRFPEVRNSDGPSFNLRNNAVYDRGQDLVLIGPTDGATTVQPLGKGRYHFRAHGDAFHIVFRPRFYQKHKNIAFFEPWKRQVRRDSTAGWCSWWAYETDIDEKTVLAAADVFARNLKDFGLDTIQLDDGYEAGAGAPPGFWKTNSKFPSGLDYLAKRITAMGLRAGIWVGSQVSDETVTKQHPEWFACDPDGKAHRGPWIDFGMDGSNKTALQNLILPVFEQFKKDGFKYVKIDSLRHLLYDSYYPCRAQFEAKGTTPELAWRDYLSAARRVLGDDTYLLACWGVLPEAVGIADACRLGTDGFGPSTMLQYNSWNNVVWRNDPDHVDIHGAGEDIIRPTLVSMAGAQLLLSDKAEFYEDQSRLEGAKRAVPIPFTLPGQLYDFDPTKTDNLINGLRNKNGGTNPGPIDADQRGPECPWWQLDVSRPFESWTILTRLSWQALPEQHVSFSDLGLAPGRYAVYEFWSKKYLGEFDDSFEAAAQPAKGTSVYCIRKVLDHPQVISTSRHITQGGPDLIQVKWDAKTRTLSGTSKVVRNDPYELRVRTAGLRVKGASWDVTEDNGLSVMRFNPKRTGDVNWAIRFTK
ncbi:MAG TPA: alpha-galactosidase [Fimbriimonas sp.]|nr:alpha-galactosidase [Fimbriimonas sp.]